MKGRQRTTLHALIWIVVGMSLITVGFLFHNGLGGLSFFTGLLVIMATLYVWFTVTIWRDDPTWQPSDLSEEDETEELFESASPNAKPKD